LASPGYLSGKPGHLSVVFSEKMHLLQVFFPVFLASKRVFPGILGKRICFGVVVNKKCAKKAEKIEQLKSRV
jgi:hypothetical protein